MIFTDMIKKFLKKRDEIDEERIPQPIGEAPLPAELEQFRLPPRREPRPREPVDMGSLSPTAPPAPTVREAVASTEVKGSDRMELIIQKLETIDARLKLIEERMK